MPTHNFITDGFGSKRKAEVTNKNALKVATINYDTWQLGNAFLANPLFGTNMAVNAATVTAEEFIHNGIDNVYWTASAISGSWNFNSTTRAHTGTYGINATGTVNNDTAQLDKGSLIDLSPYSTLTGWIYLSSWDDRGTKDVEIYAWDGVNIIGTVVGIRDYIDVNDTGVWQKFTIPFIDLNIIGLSIQYLRITTISIGVGSAPNYHLDDISFVNSIPAEFQLNVDKNVEIFIDKLSLFVAGNYNATLLNASVPNLSYNELLGQIFSTGFILRVFQEKSLFFSRIISNIGDIIQYPGVDVDNIFSNGTVSCLRININFIENLRIKLSRDDNLVISIVDDFSVFDKFTASCRYKYKV